MKRRSKPRDAIEAKEALAEYLGKLEYLVDLVLVEGSRDLEALRSLGFQGEVVLCSRVGVPDADLVESISRAAASVVILTDFDEEGRALNKRLSRLLERKGLKVERSLRREARRLMAYIGVYAVESLDDAVLKIKREKQG